MFPSKCLKFSKWWILYPTFFSHNSAACNPNLDFNCNLHHQSCGKFVKPFANKCIYIYIYISATYKIKYIEIEFPIAKHGPCEAPSNKLPIHTHDKGSILLWQPKHKFDTYKPQFAGRVCSYLIFLQRPGSPRVPNFWTTSLFSEQHLAALPITW
jgi:hypothetical protein